MKKHLHVGILSITGLGALCAGVLLLAPTFTPVPVAPAQPQTKPTIKTPATSESLLTRVNEERAKIGVAPLVVDEGVQKSAQLKSDDMVARNYRSHYLPENPKATLTQEMYSYIEPVCSSSGENYTSGQNGNQLMSTEQAINAWLNSPPHKAAILDSKYTKTGFGVSESVVVQHFCVAR